MFFVLLLLKSEEPRPGPVVRSSVNCPVEFCGCVVFSLTNKPTMPDHTAPAECSSSILPHSELSALKPENNTLNNNNLP